MGLFNKKGFSASQSRMTSRRLRNSHIGTHNRVAPTPSRRMNASSVGFSSSRKQKRAARGVVDHIRPTTTSGESSAAYSRRVNTREFSQQIQSQRRIRQILTLAVIAVIIVAVGVIAGINAFFGILGSKLALEDDSAREVLVEQTGDEPFYMLVTADLDATNGSDSDVDLVTLVRVDEQQKRATFLGIPSNTYVSLSDGTAHQIRDARAVGGTKELVSTVSSLCDVPISHLVTANAQGITDLVEEMGGVTLNLSEEVDDPSAGGVYIPQGQQTLDGSQLLTLLRASNFSDGVNAQMANQSLAEAVAMSYLSKDTFLSLASRLDRCAGMFKTDWSGNGLYSALTALHGFTPQNMYTATIPGYRDSVEADASYVVASSSLSKLMEQVKAGERPLLSGQVDTSSVNPAAVKVEVRNGSGIDGGATAIADILSAAGYQIADTGNADSYVYNETLAVYKDSKMQAAAEAVVESLGTGRAIAANGFYSFNADVLVILGGDWKPQS